jgi:hypothetical protein
MAVLQLLTSMVVVSSLQPTNSVAIAVVAAAIGVAAAV